MPQPRGFIVAKKKKKILLFQHEDELCLIIYKIVCLNVTLNVHWFIQQIYNTPNMYKDPFDKMV